jgi:hypothetical protein
MAVRNRRSEHAVAAERAASRRPLPASGPAGARVERAWPWSRLRSGRAALLLVLFVIVAHAAILSTPGFYSHDEWQKVDNIEALGFATYARLYGAVHAGPDFGFPVRPIGFLEQGLAALWMRSAPWLAHLVSVLNHAAAALALAWVLVRARVAMQTLVIATVLFVVSPLAALATGWIGASFDQLYVVFLLLVAAVLLKVGEEGMTPRRAASLAALTGAALLCKETAVVAPAGVALIAWVERRRSGAAFRWRPYAAALALVGAPVVAYLALRWPAIVATLQGHGTTAYTPSLSYVPQNALHYFAFPFLTGDADMSTPIAPGSEPVVRALAIHAAALVMLGWMSGIAMAAAYVCAYALFLVPVLALPFTGAHYLYGAAPCMALMLALLTSGRGKPGLVAKTLVVVAGCLTIVHTVHIQRFVRATGVCQAHFLASLDKLLQEPAIARAARMRVIGDSDAPLYVGERAVFARKPYSRNDEAFVVFGPRDSAHAEGEAVFRMSPSCSLVAP